MFVYCGPVLLRNLFYEVFNIALRAPALQQHEQVFRIIRTNVFPILLLTAVVFLWCTLEFVGKFFPVFAILGKSLRFVAGAFTGKKRRVEVMRPGRKIRSRFGQCLLSYLKCCSDY